MIEDPPLLRIKAAPQRPGADSLDRFANAETGHICDALGGLAALDAAIKPVGATPPAIIGPALTVDCGPADVLALFAAVAEARPGDVIVIATGGYRGTAALGDQVAAMARNAGVAGIVTDGMVRDIKGIEAVGLPVFAAGITPNSPYAKGPGQIGFEIDLGGRRVCSGDLVVADLDGVAVVPHGQIDAAAAALEEIRAAETALAARVADGLVCLDHVRKLLASPRVRRE